MSSDVIGGIGLQKQFGIELLWPSTTNDYIYNIEAKFGRKIIQLERFQRAEKSLKVNNPRLLDIFKKNQNVFIADKWDIGCTPLVKHKIETKGGPINVRPFILLAKSFDAN